MDSSWAVNPADDLFKQLETCRGPYRPDMIDDWAIDDQFDVEQTTERTPLSLPTPGPMVVQSRTWSLK